MKRCLRYLVAVLMVLAGGAQSQEKVLTVTEPDLRAAASQKVEPDYPAVARQIRLTGSVELEIVVDHAGAVERASVVRGNTLLTGPSLQAIRKWKFKPFAAEGNPAKASGPITFNFQM
ncbi:MAG: energy transducer TonB [Bryobacterales bacterium]|nr:energy transducer TonB [Bryobacterales bacterium]